MTALRFFWRADQATKLLIWLACVGLADPSHAGVYYQRLKSFGFLEQTAINPAAPLIEGTDGALYGTTYAGGTNNGGTAFKLNKDGGGYKILHSFASSTSDGVNPFAALIEGSDGALYGTTFYGGSSNVGTVFKLNPDGSAYRVLHSFAGGGEGGNPSGVIEGSDGTLYGTAGSFLFRLNKDGNGYGIVANVPSAGAELLEGSDGALYGTTWSGGTNSYGTAFKLNKDGSGFTVLHNFSADGSDGYFPRAALAEGSDGALYGTTSQGGSFSGVSAGTVFKLERDGSGYAIVHSFGTGSADGWNPRGALIQGSDGKLYGTTEDGGTNGVGTVYTVSNNGSDYQIVHSFGFDGANPAAGLMEGSDGALYGTMKGGAGNVFRLNRDGSAYHVLHNFSPTAGDGVHPRAGLIEGNDGTLYGTTSEGGVNGGGTIFKVNRDGNGYSVLYDFGATTNDASNPQSELVEGSDGALYGTSFEGGNEGVGTVFAINKTGSGYKVLVSFSTVGSDGQNPAGRLIEASDGMLYGTTYFGGRKGVGAVFTLNKDGSGYSVVRSFSDTGGEGWHPSAGLTEGSDGALYGTTWFGGRDNFGTVFKLEKDHGGYHTLHSFSATGGDGQNPAAALLEGGDGSLYGVTSDGGTNGYGAVFKLNKDGSAYKVLHSFDNFGDGAYPRAALVEGSDGGLYGTTPIVGNQDAGTIFTLSKEGSKYSVLYRFSNTGTDGRSPRAGLLKASNGAFYGTTSNGGDLQNGTVFRLLPPETPTMVGVTVSGGAAQVGFAGLGGYRYQALRSVDLINWNEMATITMPSAGIFTMPDSLPLIPAAFYRVAWVP